MITLRNYQSRVKSEIYQHYRDGHKRILGVMPTGAGKTVLAASIVKDAYLQNLRVNFIVPYNLLLRQTQEEFKQWGMDAGIVGGGYKERRSARVQIISYQTMAANRDLSWLNPQLTVVDECHITSFSAPMLELFPKWAYKTQNQGKLLGLTATPWRSSKYESLGDIYPIESLVLGPSYKELIKNGSLVYPIYYEIGNCYGQNMKSDIDYNFRQWVQYGQNDQTIVFANSKSDCLEYKEKFNDNGISAEIINAETSKSKRREYIEAYKRFEIKVLISVWALSAGFNARNARVLMYDSNDHAIAPIIQKKGRVMRSYTYPTGRVKKDCIILDCRGVKQRVGRIDEIEVRRLDLAQSPSKQDGESPMKQCPKCFKFVVAAARKCKCGHNFEFVPGVVEPPSGDLKRTFETPAQQRHYKCYVELLISHYKVGNPLSVADETFRSQYGYEPFDDWKRGAIVDENSSDEEKQKFAAFIRNTSPGNDKYTQLSLFFKVAT